MFARNFFHTFAQNHAYPWTTGTLLFTRGLYQPCGPVEIRGAVSCGRRFYKNSKDKKYTASAWRALNGRPTSMCKYFEQLLT
jgi:hypothetical protein